MHESQILGKVFFVNFALASSIMLPDDPSSYNRPKDLAISQTTHFVSVMDCPLNKGSVKVCC